MMRTTLLSLVLCSATILPCATIAAASTQLSPKAQRAIAALENFDEIVLSGLKEFNVPGIAIGIIADDQIIYAKGLGFRDLEQNLPATADTLFPIGSCTKAFTSFALGSMVEEGLLEWDQPVIDILQEFRLWDQYATQSLTIRDLLSHRSGLPRHDFMWYNSDANRQDMIARLRYLEPACELRERFNYNNLMYLVVGAAMERAAGKPFEQIVKEKIFQPLGMQRTGFSVLDMQGDNDFASPYLGKGDQLKKLPVRDISLIAPAGAMISSVNEMSRWLQMQLNCGIWQGSPLIGYGTLKEMHAPQVVISGYPESKEARVSAYGLGWCVQTYRGIYNVSHDGGVDGFTSIVSLLPQERIGVVILCNKNLSPLPRILGMHAFDLITGLPPINWLEEGIEGITKNRQAQSDSQLNEDLNRKKGTVPSHPLEEFEGMYEHPGYGRMQIEVVDGFLRATFNNINYDLSHWHYNVFSVEKVSEDLIIPREGLKFSFSGNINGEIDTLLISLESNAPDIVFKKNPQDRHESLAYLSQFLGTYEIYGYTVDIILKNHKLFSIVPGQPLYELVPGGENEFTIKSHSGYLVRFVLNPDKSVQEVLLIQPYGVVFSAKPKKI